MDLQDINSLTDDPSSVPIVIRIGVVIAIFGLIVFMGFKMFIADKIGDLEQRQNIEVTLKKTFEKKQLKASQLPAYLKQLEEMRFSFGTLVRQLPGKTEIPELILDISEKGIFHGLEIDLFKPGREVHQEFYIIKPITLKARGSYNQLASFVSDISGLARIVTINNINLTPTKDKRLAMTATINTYRYAEELVKK